MTARSAEDADGRWSGRPRFDALWAIGLAQLLVACTLLGTLVTSAERLPSAWLLWAAAMVSGGGAVATVGLAARRWKASGGRRRPPGKIAPAADALDPAQTLQELQASLEAYERELVAREHQLATRLVTFHEWTEFPNPGDPADASPSFPGEASYQDLQSQRELVDKDRQLHELLERESRRVYDAILANRYQRDGQFQWQLLRDEAVELATRVARIYEPGVEQPLLETSANRVLRAASRGGLHLLVLLDGLPLKVQEQTFKDLYRYVQGAVRAYGTYKAAEPYLSYASTAFYLGRFALGANPVSLAAWWALGALGKEGAKAVTTQVLNRQALKLLGDVLRIIAYEAAGIYGGDFRHRDPNWIYAAELTELLSVLPLSSETLSAVLRELSGLPLRSEYDRIFLYRCLAERRSAQPARYLAAQVLTAQQRAQVAHRLEQFHDRWLEGLPASRLARWQRAATDRLDVPLRLAAHDTPPPAQQRRAALRSLAGFLLEVKQLELDQLAAILTDLPVWEGVEPTEVQRQLEELRGEPPYYFEQPELPADSAWIDPFLIALCRLEIAVPPRQLSGEELIVESGLRLRRSVQQVEQLLDREAERLVRQRLLAEPEGKRGLGLPAAAARVIARLLVPEERIEAVFTRVAVEGVEVDRWAGRATAPLLLVTTRRALLLTVDGPRVLWRAEGPLEALVERGLIRVACRLRGGVWLDAVAPQGRLDQERIDGQEPAETPRPGNQDGPGEGQRSVPQLVVYGGRGRRAAEAFAPLLALAGRSVASSGDGE